MHLELIIHPIIAAAAVLAVVLAYIVKRTKKLHYNLHYVTGILAFAFSMIAFPLGLYFVLTNGGSEQFPAALIFHSLNFFVAIGLIVIQGGLGMGMLLFGRKRSVLVTHRRLAKYVLIVFLLQAVLGILTLYGIEPYIFAP